MSKSFDITFTQTFKMVVSDEVIAAFRPAVAGAHAALLKAGLTDKAARLGGLLQCETDEELIATVLKANLRGDVRDSFITALADDPEVKSTKFAPALVTVVPRG